MMSLKCFPNIYFGVYNKLPCKLQLSKSYKLLESYAQREGKFFMHLYSFKRTGVALSLKVALFTFHFSLFTFSTPSVLTAQNPVVAAKSVDKLSWKAHEKLGRTAAELGRNADAADHFDAAFLLKPDKLELAYNAAIAFKACRDYAKAAERFRSLLNNPKYPTAQLDYAVSLQQKGDFDEAIPEFSKYLTNYNAKDRETVKEAIEQYISGCVLGIKQTDSAKIAQVHLEHLDINTPDNDIAPVPFGDDVLYFTTINHANIAKIFRTQQADANTWSAVIPLTSLKIPEKTPFGNGTFSPDGNRFYCTMCQTLDKKNDKKRVCGIYFLKRTTDGWTPPTRLPDRINAPDGNTTHAFVMHKGNKEIMFFASNRIGGQGGMDIWLTSRFKNDENSEFESPLNLGGIVNTEGDEVTPFYDAEATALYFASNGRATIGGLDIFRSEGFQQRWTSPLNMGVPYNSSADDYYFAKNATKTGGFFVSNRSLGMEKMGTRDDDIFQFLFDDRNELTVVGQIFEKKTTTLLENARVSLYEKRGTGDGRLLTSVMCPTGAFRFPLLPKKSYTLDIEKDGFRLESTNFSTLDTGKVLIKNQIKDFYLEHYAAFVSNSEMLTAKISGVKTPEKGIFTEGGANAKNTLPNDVKEPSNNKIEEKTTQIITFTDLSRDHREGGSSEEKNKSESANSKNVQFKIQVLAYDTDFKDNISVKKLERVQDLGDFETETATINGKTFRRVLIPFDSYTTAVAALQKIKDRSLTDAFLIRYEDGKRTNKSK
jgi:tetratricopeptide (TPR) repeat protein